MEDITISEPIRRQLRASLLEERDLVDSIRQRPHEAVPGAPGSYRCLCTVVVRRPFDPETAELKEVEVTLQRMDTGWMVAEVRGLGAGIDEEGAPDGE